MGDRGAGRRSAPRADGGASGWIVLIGAWVALVELQARSPWLVLGGDGDRVDRRYRRVFSGRAFGRRKLAPRMSPGKTWEGVYGASGVAVALYALCAGAVRTRGRAARCRSRRCRDRRVGAVYWRCWRRVSVVGDLFESLLKRHAGVKDSGALLPGHGGVLDRTDALLAAMPLAALAAQCFLVNDMMRTLTLAGRDRLDRRIRRSTSWRGIRIASRVDRARARTRTASEARRYCAGISAARTPRCTMPPPPRACSAQLAREGLPTARARRR